MAEAIEAVQSAYIDLSQGRANVPARLPLPVPDREAVVLYMPAYLPERGGLGAKMVTVFPRNQDLGVPTIYGLVVMHDAQTGRPTAIIEAAHLTALRTGAASGVATRLLARPDAHVAAIFGAGAQGRTQLEGVCTVRDIQQAWVYDVRPEAARRFVADMCARGEPIPRDLRVASSPSEAVRCADVICAATTSRQPVFSDADIQPGTHINGIGSYSPEMQEVPAETVRRARVFVDSTETCVSEAGDLQIPLTQGVITSEHVETEIGQVAAGARPGRTSPDEITFFKSVGNAVQDVAVALLILERARTLDLGTELDL